MKTVKLLLRKDLKRYSWALITLAVFGMVNVYSGGTALGMQGLKINQLLQLLSGMIGGILFFVVIVMVVQEETLTDPDAYWLARPLNRLHILTAKIGFLVVLLGIGIASDLLILGLNGGFSRAGYALTSGLLVGLAIWQWQIFLAAQTRSLPRYLLLMVALVVGFCGSMALLFSAASSLDLNQMALLPAKTPSHIVAILQAALWLAAASGILIFFYLKRRRLAAWALLLPTGLLAAILLPGYSFLGMRHWSSDDDGPELKLIAVVESGTMHTGGTEFINYRGIFEPMEAAANIRVVPSYVRLENDEEEIEVETYNASQALGAIIHDGREALEVALFSIERSTLEQIDGPVRLSMGYNLSISTQQPVGQLPVEQNQSIAVNGDRLILRSFSRTDTELNLQIAAHLSQYAFEPSPPVAYDEPLQGRFLFDIEHIALGAELRSKVYQNWEAFGNGNSVRIEAPLSEDEALEDYRLILYKRQIESTHWNYINSVDVDLLETL
jgi:hypothetical protein